MKTQHSPHYTKKKVYVVYVPTTQIGCEMRLSTRDTRDEAMKDVNLYNALGHGKEAVVVERMFFV